MKGKIRIPEVKHQRFSTTEMKINAVTLQFYSYFCGKLNGPFCFWQKREYCKNSDSMLHMRKELLSKSVQKYAPDI
jgi:hypothetical protein